MISAGTAAREMLLAPPSWRGEPRRAVPKTEIPRR